MNLSLIRKQDLSVLLLYYCGFSATRTRLLRRQGIAVTSILTFHDIPEVENFRSILQWLHRNTNVISLDDFCSGCVSSERVNVVITFDDGYKSWVTVAAPELQALKMPATFFVSSGFLNLPKEKAREFVEQRLQKVKAMTGNLTANEVRQLSNEGFAIGGHTVNHVRLSEMTEAAAARHEIETDKSRLESIIEKEVRFFSYPYGAFRNSEIDLGQIVEDTGYAAAVTTVSGFNTCDTGRYVLRRELAPLPLPVCVVAARVMGNYDAVRTLKRCAARKRRSEDEL